MAAVAQTLQGALEQFVKPHLVHASFPVDRFFNKMAFMAVILQAIAIIVANFAAKAKISCTPEGGGGAGAHNATLAHPSSGGDIGRKAYAESYCYSQGVDQTLTPNHTIPADLHGVLHHYLLQFYLPLLFLLQGVSLYMPYYAWSKTVGEELRDHIQFVVDLSLKLLDDEEEKEDHVHTDSCKNKRMQKGRPSKADVLTDSALKQRLKRWYCKSKHTRNYYVFQMARAAMLLLWISFYVFCPGFRHRDIRYEFTCVIRSREDSRYMCVLLQASIFELGWTGNLCILTFCLLLLLHQTCYVFPFVFSCRCTCCRTKRCLASCRKECKSHYFQRILGIVVQPKREPPGSNCCSVCIGGDSGSGYEQLNGGTDYYSPRMVDRFYVSRLCYENSHLLDKVIPDMGSANAADEFSSLGNIASIAMKLDNKADDAAENVENGLNEAEGQAKKSVNPFLSKLRRAKSKAEDSLDEAKSAAKSGLDEAKSAAESGLDEAKSAAESGLDEAKSAAESGLDEAKSAAESGLDEAKSAAESGLDEAKSAAK